METLNPVVFKKSAKETRERKVLLGLIEYYLKTGKPVGSNTLKETGFEDLSSATIRNYFASLEQDGYLTQQHSSGGRIPTNRAYRLYADEQIRSPHKTAENDRRFRSIRDNETKEIATFLPQCAEILSQVTSCAIFLSAPRFDHDFVTNLKVVPIDHSRALCVLITDFGVVQTEMLATDKKLTAFAAKRIEAYFHWRLTGLDKPENLEFEEEALAKKFYNELMVRYIVGYTNFSDESLYRTGFSRLLEYPEFRDSTMLASSLTLFENAHSMKLILKECVGHDELKVWIGEDLAPYGVATSECTAMAIPYHINGKAAGAFGLLGPARMPYKELFDTLRTFEECVSEALTRNIFKFKISYRQPEEQYRQIGHSRPMLIENKTTR